MNDLLLTGNFFPFRVQEGRCDAGIGCLMKGNNKGNFTVVKRVHTGLSVPGDVRGMISLKSKKGSLVIISKNNSSVWVIQKNNSY